MSLLIKWKERQIYSDVNLFGGGGYICSLMIFKPFRYRTVFFLIIQTLFAPRSQTLTLARKKKLKKERKKGKPLAKKGKKKEEAVFLFL